MYHYENVSDDYNYDQEKMLIIVVARRSFHDDDERVSKDRLHRHSSRHLPLSDEVLFQYLDDAQVDDEKDVDDDDCTM